MIAAATRRMDDPHAFPYDRRRFVASRSFVMRLILAAVCALASAWPCVGAHAQSSAPSSTHHRARVIVKLRNDSSLAKAAGQAGSHAKALGARIGLPMRDGLAVSDREQVVFADDMTSEEVAQRLAREEDVEYAVPDERRHILAAPNDPLYFTGAPGTGPAVGQWYLRAPAGDVKSSIDAETAWSVTTGSASVVVAVLDTGVRFEHPDLRAVAAGGNLLPGYDMVSDVAVANDGNGRDADASDPGDWLTQAEASQPDGPFEGCADGGENSSWHGTQTAGLIAALTNNGIGMASVARNVRVLPVRVLGKCGGFDSDIIAGMRWAAGFPVPGVPLNGNRARVINMSLGSEGRCSAAYQSAVNDIVALGTIIVASAGNEAGHAVAVPANCAGVVAVAGLRHVGTKVGFSSLGREVVVSAPAGNCVNTDPGTPCLYPILTTSNGGVTTPGGSIYTDAFNASLGTSFAAPLVSGTVALMLSVQPGLTAQQVTLVLQSTARPFPQSGAAAGSGPVNACTAPQVDASGKPIDQLECYCTKSTCGAGMLDAGAAVLTAKAGIRAGSGQFEGLWWNSPPGSESGWGINLAEQADVIFATWFTYDAAGRDWWLSMTANRTADNVYSGTLYEAHAAAFGAPFDATPVTQTPVGQGTLTFSDANNATFEYTVNGVAQKKAIARQVFGTLPVCTFGLHPELAFATNYQDLWWNAPSGSEAGWGINLAQQSNTIFATWFTYDSSGNPMWLSAEAANVGPAVYSGTLYRSSGPPFNAMPFDPNAVKRTSVGAATLSFSDGNTGLFEYVVDGIHQTKPITRQVFRAPGTMCH